MPKADLSFKVFWDAYPDHHARAVAERIWKRMSQKDRRAALAAVAPYREECEARGVAFKYAYGWLTDRRWEDYSDPAATKKEHRGPEAPVTPEALDNMETW